MPGQAQERSIAISQWQSSASAATTLGIPFDADKAWDEREQQYKLTGDIVKTRAFVQTAEGDKAALWTSVISAVVFIL